MVWSGSGSKVLVFGVWSIWQWDLSAGGAAVLFWAGLRAAELWVRWWTAEINSSGSRQHVALYRWDKPAGDRRGFKSSVQRSDFFLLLVWVYFSKKQLDSLKLSAERRNMAVRVLISMWTQQFSVRIHLQVTCPDQNMFAAAGGSNLNPIQRSSKQRLHHGAGEVLDLVCTFSFGESEPELSEDWTWLRLQHRVLGWTVRSSSDSNQQHVGASLGSVWLPVCSFMFQKVYVYVYVYVYEIRKAFVT